MARSCSRQPCRLSTTPAWPRSRPGQLCQPWCRWYDASTHRNQPGGNPMAKIRHIAIRSEYVEGTAAYLQDVFGLELVQRRPHGPIDMSDGDINITILP